MATSTRPALACVRHAGIEHLLIELNRPLVEALGFGALSFLEDFSQLLRQRRLGDDRRCGGGDAERYQTENDTKEEHDQRSPALLTVAIMQTRRVDFPTSGAHIAGDLSRHCLRIGARR